MTERQLKIICYFLYRVYAWHVHGMYAVPFEKMFEEAERRSELQDA